MPKFKIMQYLVSTVSTEVEADNQVEALRKLFEEEIPYEVIDEHFSIDENSGMSFEEFPEVDADQLNGLVRELGYKDATKEGWIPSVGKIEQV